MKLIKDIIPKDISLSDVCVYRLEVPPTTENLIILNNIKRYVYFNNLFILSPISISPYSIDLIKVNETGYKYTEADWLVNITNIIFIFKPIGCTLYVSCADPVKKMISMFISYGRGIDKMVSAIDEDSTYQNIVNLYNYILGPYGIILNDTITNQLINLWNNIRLLEGSDSK